VNQTLFKTLLMEVATVATDLALLQHVHLVLEAPLLTLGEPQVQQEVPGVAIAHLLRANEGRIAGTLRVAKAGQGVGVLTQVAKVHLIVEEVLGQPSAPRVCQRVAPLAALDLGHFLVVRALPLVAPALTMSPLKTLFVVAGQAGLNRVPTVAIGHQQHPQRLVPVISAARLCGLTFRLWILARF
jgi:hypothetical protein